MLGRRRCLVGAVFPLSLGLLLAAVFAWRTQHRLAARQVGTFCVVAADDPLAHRAGKERSVQRMLARAATRGDGQRHRFGWMVQYLSTDLIGLAFTTTVQRASWYDALPRCHSAGSAASSALGNEENSARSSGRNTQRHIKNQ